ncbi:hypothetical protein EYF80_005270 [Liparis tanakae]|uniref:Uncharacterized protein n=1 Tax=Liparis tanakae TaxID=230148 RepID=A0A4Z2J2Y2_9TELE|nr:hypothetical protein EYF80_005270 [Liparis tanakae]
MDVDVCQQQPALLKLIGVHNAPVHLSDAFEVVPGSGRLFQHHVSGRHGQQCRTWLMGQGFLQDSLTALILLHLHQQLRQVVAQELLLLRLQGCFIGCSGVMFLSMLSASSVSPRSRARLISDFGEQEDPLGETGHNLDHGVQQCGTVLQLRSRRLALGWRLEPERWTHCKILFDDLQEEVRVQLLQVLHAQRQAMQSGEVCVHCIIQQVGHLFLGAALLPCQNGT